MPLLPQPCSEGSKCHRTLDLIYACVDHMLSCKEGKKKWAGVCLGVPPHMLTNVSQRRPIMRFRKIVLSEALNLLNTIAYALRGIYIPSHVFDVNIGIVG